MEKVLMLGSSRGRLKREVRMGGNKSLEARVGLGVRDLPREPA
jgi:hypothetical protein